LFCAVMGGSPLGWHRAELRDPPRPRPVKPQHIIIIPKPQSLSNLL
jgi:hypothetical protein